MELSITAVSKNRRFTKALVRYSSSVKILEDAIKALPLAGAPFEMLQVVFLDRDADDFIRAVGTKGGTLFQVEVAVPSTDEVLASAPSFVALVASRVKRAAQVSGLNDGVIVSITREIDKALASA